MRHSQERGAGGGLGGLTALCSWLDRERVVHHRKRRRDTGAGVGPIGVTLLTILLPCKPRVQLITHAVRQRAVENGGRNREPGKTGKPYRARHRYTVRTAGVSRRAVRTPIAPKYLAIPSIPTTHRSSPAGSVRRSQSSSAWR